MFKSSQISPKTRLGWVDLSGPPAETPKLPGVRKVLSLYYRAHANSAAGTNFHAVAVANLFEVVFGGRNRCRRARAVYGLMLASCCGVAPFREVYDFLSPSRLWLTTPKAHLGAHDTESAAVGHKTYPGFPLRTTKSSRTDVLDCDAVHDHFGRAHHQPPWMANTTLCLKLAVAEAGCWQVPPARPRLNATHEELRGMAPSQRLVETSIRALSMEGNFFSLEQQRALDAANCSMHGLLAYMPCSSASTRGALYRAGLSPLTISGLATLSVESLQGRKRWPLLDAACLFEARLPYPRLECLTNIAGVCGPRLGKIQLRSSYTLNNNNNNNNNHHTRPSPKTVHYPRTRFRLSTVADDPATSYPHPRIPPFRPRQRAPGPPLPRFNYRAAIFHGIHSRLFPDCFYSPLAPLGPVIVSAGKWQHLLPTPMRLSSASIGSLVTSILSLSTFLIPSPRRCTDTSLTHTPVNIRSSHRASSSCFIPEPPCHSHHTLSNNSSFSTPLQDHLKPVPSPSRFFVDFCGQIT
ncbi:hypothetical protein C8R44DRAFT_981805 [Mycena epipterygia]|nr:hypothetical protein C8R44DRAFT_981805 [Mycena epipterygia]